VIEREELSGVARSNGQERAGQERSGQERSGQDEIDRVLPAMRDLRSRARVTNLARAVQLDAALERAAGLRWTRRAGPRRSPSRTS